jgi:hypothetical protein
VIVFTDLRRVPFQIDEADYEAVSRYTWSLDSQGYPTTNIGKQPHCRLMRLHPFLLGNAPKGLEWDHENRDKLDNRRRNLRAVSHSANVRNQDLRIDNMSGHRGVAWDARDRKWRAHIFTNGKKHHLGSFDTKEAAITARLAAEKKLWGKS